LLSPKDLFLEAVGNAYCSSLEEKTKAYEAFLSRKKKAQKEKVDMRKTVASVVMVGFCAATSKVIRLK